MTSAELFASEHEAHDRFLDARFSRTLFESEDDKCRHCGHPLNGHYDGRCPIVGLVEAQS